MSIDVIKLAREIADKDKVDPFINGFFILTLDELSRFSARVLEEAAKVCDDMGDYAWQQYKGTHPQQQLSHRFSPFMDGASDGADRCADAIRALKPQE